MALLALLRKLIKNTTQSHKFCQVGIVVEYDVMILQNFY